MDAVGGGARTEASDAKPPVVSVGEIVAGKFRIERVIGEGGMGVVAEATHLQLDERVALKFLHHDALAAPDIVSRFKQEPRAAVKLKSEHIARVIDVGTRDDGAPFMVMELLEGSDLSNVLAERQTSEARKGTTAGAAEFPWFRAGRDLCEAAVNFRLASPSDQGDEGSGDGEAEATRRRTAGPHSLVFGQRKCGGPRRAS